MGYEEDFVKEEFVELDIEGYEKGDFVYKPTTAGEENDWINDYVYTDEEGKTRQDFGKLNMLKLSNLVSVPYSRETLKVMSGVDKDWSDMKREEKWKVIRKLKPIVFDKIIKAVNSVDKGSDESKKN